VRNSLATRLSISTVVCSWLLLVSQGVAHAQVVYDLPKLIDSSDVVAVVRVTGVNQTSSGAVKVPGGNTIPAHFRVAELHLQDILKGEPASRELTVRYTILYSPGGWAGGIPQGYTISDTLIPNATRLVFLRGVDGHYEFTDGSYLSVVCAPEPSTSDSSPDTLSRVLSLLVDAVFSTNVSEQDKAEAIRQLGAVDRATVVPPLRTFVASEVGRQSEFLRTEALVALLNHKDESVVGLAESELVSGSDSYWKSNLLFALTQAVPPSRSIPILAKAFALPGAQMRASAAVAIYQTDSSLGIPPLLEALDDTDPEVAFAVMQGLGNLTKDYEWRPESMERDANWFRCLDHWHEFRKRSNGAR
jgi:hypothetical protein